MGFKDRTTYTAEETLRLVNQQEEQVMDKSPKLLSQERVLKMCTDEGLLWIDSLIGQCERGAQSLRQYRARYVEACENSDSGDSTPVNVISWTVNEVNNIERNFRLDMAVNIASAIAISTALVKRAR